MANYQFHAADSRGDANHGWLRSRHTFSFSNYYEPDRMNFGTLRVLNDDHVAAGMGFGTHAHDNMEIISIPLSGDLEHRDSMGNVEIIRNGDIQVMSAGTGIKHSEYNKSKEEPVKFLQIWVVPNQRDVEPRYDQLTLNPQDRLNTFQQVLSPFPDDEGVWLHQDAWFSLSKFELGVEKTYRLKGEGTGLYVFNLSGAIEVDGQRLSARDGLAITDVKDVAVKAVSEAEFLLMEVAMR
ncbi:pirin family protein [Sphingobacterium deserti]|uniref:Pirin domain-containing protein n=1 Tax=Sphingobacterium deserti TaxID=1229276 RepID=A0A0B8T674_9SPHI|nr:pirin family protein [Sphingobacterium deserti]KGE13399.1 Pirin domain-containing protein [Sphingobacterium deserti]